MPLILLEDSEPTAIDIELELLLPLSGRGRVCTHELKHSVVLQYARGASLRHYAITTRLSTLIRYACYYLC